MILTGTITRIIISRPNGRQNRTPGIAFATVVAAGTTGPNYQVQITVNPGEGQPDFIGRQIRFIPNSDGTGFLVVD